MELARQVLAVLFVFALLGALIWASRRGGRLGWRVPRISRSLDSRMLRSLERISLTPQHAIHVVRISSTVMVVATHPQGCTLLRQFSDSPEETTRGAGA